MRYPKPARLFWKPRNISLVVIGALLLLFPTGLLAGVITFDSAEILPYWLAGAFFVVYGVLYFRIQWERYVVREGVEFPIADLVVTLGFIAAGFAFAILFTLAWRYPAFAEAIARIPIPSR